MAWLRLSPHLLRRYSRPLAILLAFAGLALVYAAAARPVWLILDGKTRLVRTHARTVAGLLHESGLLVHASDRLSHPLDQPLERGMVVRLDQARPVRVWDGERLRTIHSASQIPANILAEADIPLYPGDRVWVNGEPLEEPEKVYDRPIHDLRIDRGYEILVTLREGVKNLRSAAPTLAQALWDGGVRLREGDRLSPPPESRLGEVRRVELHRGNLVHIQADGQTLASWTAGPTVADAIADAGLSLQGQDYVLPAETELLPEDGLIRIVRVEEQLLVELEPIPFETVYAPAEDLELDSLEVRDAGSYGVRAKRVRVRIEDGDEVSREIEEAIEVVKPEPRVLAYGTKIVVRSLSTPHGTIEYWRAVPVYATSYSPCRLGVDGCGKYTASGRTVERGVIGVIRSWYNMMKGWPVYVPGYGPGSIEDIGAGFADRDWIDLGFTDGDWEPWHDWTILYFLTPVPPLDQIPWILP